MAERTREIGIRLALGVHQTDVLRMVVGRSVVLALTGVMIGMAAAMALGRFIQNQLFGVDLFDRPTIVVVVAGVLSSAVAASYLPAQTRHRSRSGSHSAQRVRCRPTTRSGAHAGPNLR